jgi:hypothetical protein
MSGNYSLLEAYPFGAPDVSVKVGAGKKMGTGGQGVAPVEVKVAGQMDPMATAGRRRRHTKKGGQDAMTAGRRRRHTKRGGQDAMTAGRRRKHTKKGGQDAGRRHRSRKH